MKDLNYLGPGVPLMFTFIKMSIVLLTILLVLFSIYAMVSNLQGKSCLPENGCDDSVFLRMSIANKIQDQSSITVQNYLLMTFIILFIFIIQFMIYTIRKGDQRSDAEINSPSDYSLLITQLPEGVAEKDILEMIHEERHYID